MCGSVRICFSFTRCLRSVRIAAANFTIAATAGNIYQDVRIDTSRRTND